MSGKKLEEEPKPLKNDGVDETLLIFCFEVFWTVLLTIIGASN